MEKNNLYRKESLDVISSPEQMRDYMHVTSPRLWMILGAIVAILAGFIIYAATTRVESTYDLKLEYISADYLTGEIPYAESENISVGMPVRIGDKPGSIQSVFNDTTVLLDAKLDSDVPLEDGYYSLSIGESTDVSISDKMYEVKYSNGVFTARTVDDLSIFERGDVQARIWKVNWSDKGAELAESRLVTIAGARPYVITNVVAALDDRNAVMDSGLYDAEIITEERTPISFLFN